MAKSPCVVCCTLVQSFLFTHGRQRRPDSVVAPAEEVPPPPSPVVAPLAATTPALDVYGKIPCVVQYIVLFAHTRPAAASRLCGRPRRGGAAAIPRGGPVDRHNTRPGRLWQNPLVSCNISSVLLTHGRQRRPDSVVANGPTATDPPVVVAATLGEEDGRDHHPAPDTVGPIRIRTRSPRQAN